MRSGGQIPDRKPRHQVAGIVAIQSEKYPSVPVERRISTLMGLCLSNMGREIYWPVDNKSDAFKNRTYKT
ncbi:MAG: hypothetical protein ACI92E_001816 [Oceanicoccus sp.]